MQRCGLAYLSHVITSEYRAPQLEEDDEDGNKAGICIRAASLNLVDLAGSERVGCDCKHPPYIFGRPGMSNARASSETLGLQACD